MSQTAISFFKVQGRFVVAMLTALMLAATMQPVHAQTPTELAPEHLALARKFIDLTDQGATYEVTLVETGIQIMRQILPQNPEITEPLNEAITKTLESYRGQKDQLFNQFARVYALRFSQDELQQIVTFYESDIGKKLTSENVAINQDLQAVMQVFQNNLRPEFLAKVRAELKAKGIDV